MIQRRRTSPFISVLALAGLVGLLGTLAYLQYDWLGKVSDQERQRMQEGLEDRLEAFRLDLDRELAGIHAAMSIDRTPGADADSRDVVAAAYEDWKDTAAYPGLVHDLIFSDVSTREAFRYDPARGEWLSAPGFGSRTSWTSSAISTGIDSYRWVPTSVQASIQRASVQSVEDDFPAIVIPALDNVRIAAETHAFPGNVRRDFAIGIPATPNGIGSVLYVRLETEAILEQLAPEVLERHFGTDGEYDLWLWRDSPRPSLIRTLTGTNRARADARVPILGLHPEDFPEVYPSAGFLTGDHVFIDTLTEDERTEVGESGVGESGVGESGVGESGERILSVRSLRFEPTEAMAFNLSTTLERPGAWVLEAAHASGSLDAAVELGRRRNLTASFGILSVLAASGAFLMISTRRAHRLAEQQLAFVSAVSHELRTPLSVIRAAGENLADGVIADPNDARSYGRLVRDEGRRLTDTVEQILDSAGIQSGRRRYEPVPVDLEAVLDDVLDALGVPISEGAYTIDRDVAPDLGPIFADAGGIARAIQNLVGNAMKYGGSDRRVRIAARRDGRHVHIAVEDHGPGIAPMDLPYVFEPFYRGRSAIDNQVQGSGLGLSLVEQIVRQHRGSVEILQPEGGGTTVILKIPLAPEEAAR